MDSEEEIAAERREREWRAHGNFLDLFFYSNICKFNFGLVDLSEMMLKLEKAAEITYVNLFLS